MDDEMQALDIREFEIERRLDAFARARLSPDPLATARVRARVMREARIRHEAARDAARAADVIPLATRRSRARRLGMPLLAASLWLGIAVGSVAAAQAGGPLYPTRIWIEGATLPAGGTARTTAEIGRLETRLADALTAAARGDTEAVAAALGAYDAIALEALAGANGSDELEALVAAALDRHRAVLTAVAASLFEKGSSAAADAVERAIERAIEHNAAVIETLGTGKPAGSNASNGSGATGGGTGAGSTNGSGGATGGASGGGSGSGSGSGDENGDGDKPSRPPKPTPEPTAQHQPDHAQRSNQ
jgi:uncharacterized membrane protein YgcG